MRFVYCLFSILYLVRYKAVSAFVLYSNRFKQEQGGVYDNEASAQIKP